jgi:hypothetical protein
VTKIVLYRARVLPVIRELVPARMTQHVRGYRERKLRHLRYPCDHVPNSRRRHWPKSFSHKHMSRLRLFAHESAQRANFRTAKRCSWRSVLRASHICDQDHRRVVCPYRPRSRAVLISNSTSLPVRYSRGRRLLYGIKRGGTVPFSVLGLPLRLDNFTRKSIASKTATYPFWLAGSAGRRNTGVKSLCWGFKLQGLTWPFV